MLLSILCDVGYIGGDRGLLRLLLSPQVDGSFAITQFIKEKAVDKEQSFRNE